MSGRGLEEGGCEILVKSLGGGFDNPLSLFKALADGGGLTDTLLFESAEHNGDMGEKSLLVTGCAARAECRGREVVVHALSDNGVRAIRHIANSVNGTDCLALEGPRLKMSFPKPSPGDEEARLKAPSPADALRAMAFGFEPSGGDASLGPLVAGVFSYDYFGVYEDLPPIQSEGVDWPDFTFWLPDRMVWINHAQRFATAVAIVFGGDGSDVGHNDAVQAIGRIAACAVNVHDICAPKTDDKPAQAAAVPDMDDREFASLVETLKGHIVAGDVIQVVGSRTFSTPCGDPVDAYEKLRAINPSPYMFLINAPQGVLFGASPETAVKASGKPKRVEIRPIAGTRPRGLFPAGSIDCDLDNRFEAELRLNIKENAEHMMLLDLARNDVARVCLPGTRRVDALLDVERYSHVMHLVSRVTGELRPDLDALHAYVATMNMGTLVGAPKVRAAELLRTYEKTRRGPYGGAVAHLGCNGDLDSCIVIRSAVVAGGVAHVRAGAGIVFDSVAESEAAETRHKAMAVLKAISLSGGGGAP